MNETEVIARTQPGPVTQASLVADLRRLGVQPGQVLLVHSSLSALGWVAGGAPAVILALEEVLGAEGTLVMPAHSGDLSDPKDWQNPPVPPEWFEPIRQHMPAYDPDLTPTRGMGAIPECFRKQAGVLRSAHPRVSFTARGPQAVLITACHSLDLSLGEGSPLARLYELDAWVLLLGVLHDNNTSLHLSEYRADFAGKQVGPQGTAIRVDGGRRWVTFEDIELDSDDFGRLGEDYERETNAVRLGAVGCGVARLFRQRPLVDYGVSWLCAQRKHSQ